MQRTYSLEWLDLLVNVTLNPSKTQVSAITDQQFDSVLKTTAEEIDRLRSRLKGKFLGITSYPELKLLVRRYHSDLTILLDKANENCNLALSESPELKLACQAVIRNLEELLSFIEIYYGQFLGLDERVPVTYLLVTAEELRKRLNGLKSKLFRRTGDKILTSIVFDTLYNFPNNDRPITFREIIYKKEMVAELEQIVEVKADTKVYNALNELLIYRNFNKKAYLRYFTEKIAGKVNACARIQEKLDQLRLSWKEFNQMYKKPDVRLNPRYADIKDVVGNWFSEEVGYLERKLHFQVNHFESRNDGAKANENEGLKIHLGLSSDQIAILLRAICDAGILQMRSLQAAFKTIVPFLASEKHKNLSWESVRKRAYSVEDKDKQKVIFFLEKAIKHIQTY
ncbi:hypothetical protein [Dyadobacter sp. 3J3]|uniref:hypothetical protein n=1 Tax=Dyadobacter sp. 3J3 TaxID=2606600 RepID=UPI001357CB77|nr:hypothetical protein [Dyadobacter sp. 3J3]